MSYDVLAVLRRRLVATRGAARDDRPSSESTRPGREPARGLLADGGDGTEADLERSDGDEDAHLRDLPDGAGCTEIWEHLSERQAEERRQGEERRAEDGRARECRADD